MRKNAGFTMVELLVVMTIISILFSASAFAFISSLSRARDAARRKDINAVGSALELYYQDNTSYPNDAVQANCGQLDDTDDYLPRQSFPIDRINDDTSDPKLEYTWTCGGTTFCICAGLENQNGNSSDQSCTFLSTNTGKYHCVTGVQ